MLTDRHRKLVDFYASAFDSICNFLGIIPENSIFVQQMISFDFMPMKQIINKRFRRYFQDHAEK